MTLIVTPWASLDPINLPKFLILVTVGFAIMGTLASSLRQLVNPEFQMFTYAITFFLIALGVVFIASDSNKWTQVYGQYGRNTGVLSYICLALIFISVSIVSNVRFLQKLIWSLIVTGTLNSIYGLIQWLGKDPVKWSSSNGSVLGTLGNPNFLSAHISIAGLACLAMLLGKGISFGKQIGLSTNLVLCLFVAYESDSSQGLLIMALGTTLIFYFRFISVLRRWVRHAYLFVVSGISVLGVIGILNKGPLASLLYQVSVTYRGDYWRAGWRMTKDHPIVGVGIDSYADWYRFSRTEVAAIRRGPDVISNSAHNVFLDISSNGGFLLLVAYLVIVGLILRSAWRVLHKSEGFDALGVGLVSSWMGYTIQSVISINQLGLAIWGWILGGAIIGYDLYLERTDAPKAKLTKNRRPKLAPATVTLTGTLGLVIGFFVSVLPIAQDMNFRKALENPDITKIELAAQKFPWSNFYYVYASKILLNNQVNDRSLNLARLAITANPRDFNGWKALVANPLLSAEEKASAIAKMRELDPYNNTLDNR